MKLLDQWLADIQRTHPRDWDLGLDRVGEVAGRMQLLHPAPSCFLVAGTNGKGSTCEYLAQLCEATGRSYGKTTSPFFHRYNEQIVINGVAVPDQEIVLAFEAIKDAAAEISLSYFEYGALAAMWLFQKAGVEVAILEIGLGGRLDAMNVIEPDVSIITRIALDHQDWLGNTRDEIGFEKAGVMRSGKPVVVLDEDPPTRLLGHAEDLGAKLKLVRRDFTLSSGALQIGEQRFDLREGRLPQASAVAAIVSFIAAGFDLEQSHVDMALQRGALPGRFQVISDSPFTVLDVCHNPDASAYLAGLLKTHINIKKWHFVAGVFKDKDHEGIFQHLAPFEGQWYFCDLDSERSAKAEDLAAVLAQTSGLRAGTYDKVQLGLEAASRAVKEGEGLVVLGSFVTVGAALEYFG